VAWYRDRAALALIAFAYLPWLAGFNLAWESAHVPLYTLWQEAEPAYIAFAVLHCTVGDVLIGGSALLLALIAGRELSLAQWRWSRIAALTALGGAAYTVFSEWMNTAVLGNWAYAAAMPTLRFAGLEIGATPLVQWLVVPPLALYLAKKTRARTERPQWPCMKR
jgi:hypothetical protein